MESALITIVDGKQMVTLPAGITLAGSEVTVRVEGDSVILQPAKPECWPQDFFKAIHIEDGAFDRPPQGQAPPVHFSGGE